jgi:hypothetical protein
MPTKAGRCPHCGERVSPFAAGCALCGASLDPRRHQRGRRGPSLSLPRLSLQREATALVVILVLMAVFAPFFGALLGGYVAWDRARRGDVALQRVALAAAAASVVMLLIPGLQLGLLQKLGLV